VTCRRLGMRTAHWSMVALFLFAAFLAIMNQYFYSKEAIMDVLDTAYGAMGYEIMPADQLFAARLLRRAGWLWHFWSAASATLVFAAMLAYRRGRHPAYLLFAPLLLTMAATGGVLYARESLDLPASTVAVARTVHHCAAWLTLPALWWHLRDVLRPVYAAVLAALLFAPPPPAEAYRIKRVAPPQQCGADALCREGVDYLDGRKGVVYEEKIVPSCPYERCREVSRGDGRHRDAENKRILRVQRRNYAAAVALLRRSACERGNPYAAKLLYDFLRKQVNLDDPEPDRVLVRRMEKRLRLDYDEYLGLLACLKSRIGAEEKRDGAGR